MAKMTLGLCTLPLKKIAEIKEQEASKQQHNALIQEAHQLPWASSFVSQTEGTEEGLPEFEIESDEFISTIDQEVFLNKDLSLGQYQQFGFQTKADFDQLPRDVKKNLLTGMKLYFLLKPIYELSSDLDASCCGILFCKGMELYLRKNFVPSLKARFPDYPIKTTSKEQVELQNVQEKDFMLGTIRFVLQNKTTELESYMKLIGENRYALDWWNSFIEKLGLFIKKRNRCCHPQQFKWSDLRQLLTYEFAEDGDRDRRVPKIRSVFYESEVGKKLQS